MCFLYLWPSSNLETTLDHCSWWPEGGEWLHLWRSTNFMFIISLCCLIVFHQFFWSIQVYILSALPISCPSYHCAVWLFYSNFTTLVSKCGPYNFTFLSPTNPLYYIKKLFVVFAASVANLCHMGAKCPLSYIFGGRCYH